MGRGRAKAKQTKVARKLKYHAPNTDLRALERELAGGREDARDVEPDEDPYSAYADRYNPDDDEVREDDWVPPDKKLAVSAKPASPWVAGLARSGACNPQSGVTGRPPRPQGSTDPCAAWQRTRLR
ncbi:MAG TPA: DUF3073 domain-containing protein [Glycomyces sp.]|nr:DUF3073 domain-containing protein [Glycomyces sp.]